MPQWKMRVVNPQDFFNTEIVDLDLEEGRGSEKIKVGLEFVALITHPDNSQQQHCFKVIKIINPEEKEGEILHLGLVLEKIILTLELIRSTEQLLNLLGQKNPVQIIQFCPRCHLNIIPENFLELIRCPFCGKPYNLPL